MLERKNYPHLAAPVGPYVHAVKCNGLLFLSGLTALGCSVQGQGLEAEAGAILAMIQEIAAHEGATLESLLKVTIFVSTLDGIDGLRTRLAAEYGAAPPASSLVQVAALFSPHISVEIEAVLAVPS